MGANEEEVGAEGGPNLRAHFGDEFLAAQRGIRSGIQTRYVGIGVGVGVGCRVSGVGVGVSCCSFLHFSVCNALQKYHTRESSAAKCNTLF